jgi:hypothetical protein
VSANITYPVIGIGWSERSDVEFSSHEVYSTLSSLSPGPFLLGPASVYFKGPELVLHGYGFLNQNTTTRKNKSFEGGIRGIRISNSLPQFNSSSIQEFSSPY